MGIKACCVRQEFEQERNLQKVKPETDYENITNVENGAFITDKTSNNKIFETNANIFNNKFFLKAEEDLLKEKHIIKIQKKFRTFNNKNKFENEKAKIIEETQSFVNKLYEICSKNGKLPSSDDFNPEGWKKYYPSNERFFLYQKGKVFPNQIRIKNLKDKNYLEIFEGEVNIDNLKHGFGILTTPKYELKGTWRKGEFTGWGRKTKKNNEIMEGKFVNGKLNGKGFYKKLKTEYEGEFINSQKCGKGKLKTQKYIYKGDFNNDKFNGSGSIEFLDEGSKYTGNFINNEITGRGIFEWKNGDKYEGNMKKGKMDGFGKFTFNDGKIYEGEYLNGIKQGKGKLIYPGDKIYEGYFDNGLPDGEGIYKEKGKTFKVLFSKGKFIKYIEENKSNSEDSL